jgi:DNA-binding LacI/PurR family transcriptional regulator
MATIKDIARKLNISVSTVSYALNDGPRKVPDEVKARVLQTAEELGYRPNRVARSLKQGRSNTIGVAAEHTITDFYLGFFHHHALNGVLSECEEEGLDVLVFSQVKARRDKGQLDELMDGRADGILIISPVPHSAAVAELRGQKFPHVTISGDASAETVNSGVDNSAGVRKALSHLADLGHSSIGYLSSSDDTIDGLERDLAVHQIAKELNLDLRPEWVFPGSFTQEGGSEAAEAMLQLDHFPTAVFGANDESAFGFVHRLHEAGVSVPQDISVIGFDNASHARWAVPALTTIQQPVDEIARSAVRSLARLIRGEEAFSTRFAPRLIVRGSTGPPRSSLEVKRAR